MKKSLILSLFLLISMHSFAAIGAGFEVKLKSGTFVPEVTSDFESAVQPLLSENNQETLYRIVQFYEIPTNAEKEKIRAAGIDLISYIPNKAFLCGIKKNISVPGLKNLNIRSIIQMDASFKLSSELIKEELPAWALIGDEIQLMVKFYAKKDKADLINGIASLTGKVNHVLGETNVLIIQLKTSAIEDLAQNPLVQWIEPISPAPTKDDLRGSNSVRSNGLNASYPGSRKYDGSGVVVAICDDGLIGPHIDYQGRLTQHTVNNTGNHGDMTSGIFFGAGNIDPSIQGMAPGAYMHLYQIGNITITGYPQILNGVANLSTLGTVISSTSYSQGNGGVYNTDAEFTDQQISAYPQMIHLFSAGNSGSLDHGYGAGPGWGNISGGAKAGKNVICAGNLDYRDVLLSSSSRGPAADGRIKPDLCAMGNGQFSTDNPNTYQPASGTSASSPAIAGVVAQLYQAYKALNGGDEPETGLLKAALMNTAEDLGNPGPDFQNGWGRINGLKAIRILEENRYIRDSIAQGASKTHTIAVPANVSEVRIMTYWMDVEGNPNAAIALVNDINMQVVDPGLATYNPWVLDHTPLVASLNANAVRGIDSLNNVEQVTLDNPVAGTYTVNLSGNAISQGPQVYYVLYDFIYEGVELTYPIGGEGFVPGETEVIRWDASVGSGAFTLEYSTDGGNTYTAISSTIPSADRYYEWTVPAVVSADAKLRISRGTFSSESDTNFTIVGVPQNLTIVRVCPDTVEIGWDLVNGATGYEVSMLGSMYMDSIGTSTSNSFLVAGLNPNMEHWFSARSSVSAGKGRRAIAINQVPGTFNCALNNDIEVVGLLFPGEGTIVACRDLSNSEITLNFKNLGSLPASNFQLNYQVNGGPVITETLAGPIASGASVDYTFATTADFSTPGAYTTEAWGTWSSDQNHFNDSIVSTSQVINGSVVSSYPYADGFNSFPACATTSNCEQTTCNLANGWINIDNTTGFDDIDWRTDAGGTPSSNTGPTTDYDLGTAAGNYLYLEPSNGCTFQTAVLISPCLDLGAIDCGSLQFAYHMYGTNMGQLHVDVMTKDSVWEDVISPVIGNQGNNWLLATVDLTPFAGDTVNVRVRGITGSGFTSDMAIDAFTIDAFTQPTADFTYSQGPNDTLFFANNSGGSITSYSWDFGDGSASTDPNPSHHYSAPGSYDITLIVSGACGNDTMVQSFVITSVLDDLASGIEIHPNPSNGKFTVQLPQQLANQDVTIALLNVLGQPVLEVKNDINSNTWSIDASRIPNGVYFAVISSKDFSITRKVVKQ